MPLSALLGPDQRRLDATSIDDLLWNDTVHRRGVLLRCPACGGGMTARTSRLGMRHFAHLPGQRPDDCPLQHETPEHLAAKAAVMTAVRELAGWTAVLEQYGGEPGHGFQADVLAWTPPDAPWHQADRSVAFEVQISSIRADGAEERTAKHATAGVETCWLDRTGRSTLGNVPTVRLVVPASQDDIHRVRLDNYSQRHWNPIDRPLDRFVHRVLTRSIEWNGERWADPRHTAAEQHDKETDEQNRREKERHRARREGREARERQDLADIIASDQHRSGDNNTSSELEQAVRSQTIAARADAVGRRRLTVAEIAWWLLASESWLDPKARHRNARRRTDPMPHEAALKLARDVFYGKHEEATAAWHRSRLKDLSASRARAEQERIARQHEEELRQADEARRREASEAEHCQRLREQHEAERRRLVAEVNTLLRAHPAQTPKEACRQLCRRTRLNGRRVFTREELAYLVACRGVARFDLVDAVRRLQTQPAPLVWQWVEGTATHGTRWDLFSALDDD